MSMVTQLNPSHASDPHKTGKACTSYDIHLTITRAEIAAILDNCLEQKLTVADDETDKLLKIAECIREEQLSDEFCQAFAERLKTVLTEMMGVHSDSYEVANMQHEMLRQFNHCKDSKP